MELNLSNTHYDERKTLSHYFLLILAKLVLVKFFVQIILSRYEVNS